MSGSIFDALTDPTTSALMGLAQGFGQAALPTRMPTPIAATLGMGIGGLQQGLAAGQALKKGDIQNQQAKIGLDWYKSMMAPQQGGGQASTAGLMGAPQVNANGQYIVPPSMLAGMLGPLVAMGKDPSGILKLLQSYAESGVALDKNGNAFSVPGAPGAAGQMAAAKEFGTKSGGFAAPAAPTVVEVPDGHGGFRKQLMTPQQQYQYVSPGGGDGAATPASAPAATDPRSAAVNALNSIPDPKLRAMVANAIFKKGLPVEAVAPFIAGIHHESGWNPNVKDGSSGEIGLGQVMPATGKMLGYTPEQLRDPQTNLEASVQYYGQKWQEANGNPVGAYAGYNTGSVTGTPTAGYLDDTMPRLAKYGYPGIHHVAPPQPIQVAGPGAPTEANPPGFTPPVPMPGAPPQSSQGPAPGFDANNQPLPAGWVGKPAAAPVAAPPTAVPAAPTAGVPGPPVLTPQQTAAQDVEVARQKALNDAEASRHRLITTRAGVYDPVTNTEVYRQPEYHETIDPESGTEYPTFVQPGENGHLSIIGGPPGMGGKIPPTKLGPGNVDLQKHLADNFANEGKQKYDGAMQALLQLDQQDQNIKALNQSRWTSTGSLNDLRMGLSKDVNSILTPLGLSPIVDPTKVASWEDAAKVQKQLAFAQARMMGSREAASVVNMSLSATPGGENTEQGYRAVSAGYHEMNYREGDLYSFQNQWAQTHNGNLIGAEAAFNKQFPPEMYGDRAISTIHPFNVKADSLDAFNEVTQKYLPGTRVMINGDPKVIKIVPERPGAPPIPPYIKNNYMTAPASGK